MKEYWFCLVGPVDSEELELGADSPMRISVRAGLSHLGINQDDEMGIWSGWGISEHKKDEILKAMF